MYLHKLELKNIRCFEEFELTFPKGGEAGWHVLIGDNGSGKSAILKAIVVGLIGEKNALKLKMPLGEWVKSGAPSGSVQIVLDNKDITEYFINRIEDEEYDITFNKDLYRNYQGLARNIKESSFMAGYGALRRFDGDDNRNGYSKAEKKFVSLLYEGTSLKSVVNKIADADYKSLSLPGEIEKEKEAVGNGDPRESNISYLENELEDARFYLKLITTIINDNELLANGLKFGGVKHLNDSKTLYFKASTGETVSLNQLSDGSRAILALVLDLLSHLDRDQYQIQLSDNNQIMVPGIVLIDEIDAHLHPTWQTRIGGWFRQYFPNIQFIVTTHSPLICRGCETGGTIWRLPTPGTGERIRPTTEIERNRLIYGNILDAVGTGFFGPTASRLESGTDKVNRLAALNIKSITGQISAEEEVEYLELQRIFPSGK